MNTAFVQRVPCLTFQSLRLVGYPTNRRPPSNGTCSGLETVLESRRLKSRTKARKRDTPAVINAIRATRAGVSALEQYLENSDVYINGTRKWSPTEVETTILACAPVPDEWVMFGELHSRISGALGQVPANFTSAVLELERTALVVVFRQLEIDSVVSVSIEGWTFPTTYKHIVAQVGKSLAAVNQELLWKGCVTIEPKNGRGRMTVRLAK